MRLCIYKYQLACTVILGSVSDIFGHIRELFKSILRHIQYLLYPWHILITKHIQAPRYIHNTILNILTKVRSSTFNTVLNAPLSLKDAILSGVSNNIFQKYSSILKIYAAIFIFVKAYQEPQYIKEDFASEILRHTLNATHNIQADSTLFSDPAYLDTLCFSYIQSYNVRHILKYLPTFSYILVDSGIFRMLAQLDMFIYIKAYSEAMAYSAIFRTVGIFRQFQTLPKSSSCIF